MYGGLNKHLYTGIIMDGSFSQTGMGQSLKRLSVLGSPFYHYTTVCSRFQCDTIAGMSIHFNFMNSESVTVSVCLNVCIKNPVL